MSPAAVVTGAGRGIGAATVDLLVAAGWQVVAVDRSADDPDLDYSLSTKADLEAVAGRHGASVRTVVGDVRSASDMRAAVEAAVTHFGGLQAAVAAAGVISGGPPWGFNIRVGCGSKVTRTDRACNSFARFRIASISCRCARWMAS